MTVNDPFVLHHGDCRDVLATLPDASVDAVVCDPPYELGFMGKGWDAAGVAYDAGVWAEVLRVLKPGGHLLAFGGTRTYHRMACAIEDAGFVAIAEARIRHAEQPAIPSETPYLDNATSLGSDDPVNGSDGTPPDNPRPTLF